MMTQRRGGPAYSNGSDLSDGRQTGCRHHRSREDALDIRLCVLTVVGHIRLVPGVDGKRRVPTMQG